MKPCKQAIAIISILLIATSASQAAELTVEALEGEWLYTHIVMDDGQNMPVNFTTRFESDGTLVWILPTGAEYGRGKYEINGSTINYTDEKGPQQWKVVNLEQDSLHLDHRGAGMFFERQ